MRKKIPTCSNLALVVFGHTQATVDSQCLEYVLGIYNFVVAMKTRPWSHKVGDWLVTETFLSFRPSVLVIKIPKVLLCTTYSKIHRQFFSRKYLFIFLWSFFFSKKYLTRISTFINAQLDQKILGGIYLVSRYLWRGSWNFKINLSRPLFTIIFK
jgi:hypothetical protein